MGSPPPQNSEASPPLVTVHNKSSGTKLEHQKHELIRPTDSESDEIHTESLRCVTM